MDLFSRLLSSVQKAPLIQVEENGDEIVPKNESSATVLHGIEKRVGQNGAGEARYLDPYPWEGFEDRLDLAKQQLSKTKPMASIQKSSGKRKSSAEAMEVQTPQLEDDNSQQENSPLDVIGEPATNRLLDKQFKNEDLVVEALPKIAHAKRPNGTTPKRKRDSKLKPTVLPEVARLNAVDGSEAAIQQNTASKQRKLAKTINSRTLQPANSAPKPEAETFERLEEVTNPAMSLLELSDLPQRITKAKNSKVRKAIDEPATKLRADANDSSRMPAHHLTPKRVRQAQIDPDSEEYNLTTSSQVQRDARSVAPYERVNGKGAEEEPCRPSKKALGKRKAVDEPVSQVSTKKANRWKETGPQGQDLKTMGFLPLGEPSNSARHDSPSSNQKPTYLAEMTHNVWTENNGVSPQPAPPSNSQLTLNNSKPSWNAINIPVEPVNRNSSSQSLFVLNQEGLESPEVESVAPMPTSRKLRRLVDKPGPSNSAPIAKSRATPAKPVPKIPKSPQAKKNMARATLFSNGKLSADQLNSISSAVESYRELRNITQFQMNELIQSDAQQKITQELWTAICDEVPDIPRRNVQNTCRRKFHNFEARGAWTEEQDEELKRAFEEHPGKWKLIGETLNRFPEDARDRWRNYLVCGDTLKKDAWRIEEEERLRAAVKQCIKEVREKLSFSGGQRTQPQEDSLIDWQKISQLMGRTRSRLQCRNKWKKLKDREEPDMDDPIARNSISNSWRMEEAADLARSFSAKDKLELLRAVQDSGAAREGKIPWQTIKDELRGQGKRMAWKYCFRKLKDNVPGHDDMEFKDIVAYLVDVFDTAAPDEPDGFDLPIEVYPPIVKSNKKKSKALAPLHSKNTGERSSMPKERTSQKRKQDQGSDGAEETSTVKTRRMRDRMLKEGESQETADSHHDSAGVNGSADVALSFQSLKRNPKTDGKRFIRKSRRNQALSKEKVIEDPSDNEEPLMNGVDNNGVEINHEETYAATGGPAADDEMSDELEVEDFNLGAYRTDGYHPEGSPNLDTPVPGRTFKKLGSPVYANGYLDEDQETGTHTSDEDDMSDIPAQRQPRIESPEL